MKTTLYLLLFASWTTAAAGPRESPAPWGPLQSGPHAVGFRSTVVVDPSRGYFGTDPRAESPRFRPIQVSIWYPAKASPEREPMPVATYLFLSDKTGQLSAFDDARMEQAVSRRVGDLAGSHSALVRRRLMSASGAARQALSADGSFPLIVFSPSMLGTPHSNWVMGEYLASHGYIVAAHPSYGLSPEYMTTELRDLEQQARDVGFVIAYMIAHEPRIDAERIGLLGHSWGGLAIMLAAARSPHVGAVVSLDGSEEMWRDLLDRAPEFDPALFAAPYLRMHKPASHRDPDNGLWASIRHAPTYRIILDDSVQHFEFVSSRATSAWLTGGHGASRRFSILHLISDRVRRFFDAYLLDDATAREALTDASGAKQRSNALLSLHTGPNLDPPPSDAEFLRALGEDWKQAQTLYEMHIEADPKAFSEARMVRLGEMLLWSGRNREATRLLAWATRRFPESARAYEMLGNVHYWNLGQEEAALPLYRKALELDPEGLQTRIYLNQLTRDDQ